jgi:hypothetical protein
MKLKTFMSSCCSHVYFFVATAGFYVHATVDSCLLAAPVQFKACVVQFASHYPVIEHGRGQGQCFSVTCAAAPAAESLVARQPIHLVLTSGW